MQRRTIEVQLTARGKSEEATVRDKRFSPEQIFIRWEYFFLTLAGFAFIFKMLDLAIRTQ